ncbi:MAG: hypothetical protein [Caudoviricetes sp.]|nr:MAG: hypothetical protein [Caudoviricetes sp.]
MKLTVNTVTTPFVLYHYTDWDVNENGHKELSAIFEIDDNLDPVIEKWKESSQDICIDGVYYYEVSLISVNTVLSMKYRCNVVVCSFLYETRK